jgi:hypothetical protein
VNVRADGRIFFSHGNSSRIDSHPL